jgi:hypothetical protein
MLAKEIIVDPTSPPKLATISKLKKSEAMANMELDVTTHSKAIDQGLLTPQRDPIKAKSLKHWKTN